MDQILTPAAMRDADRLALERYGMPPLLLMENAGRCVIDGIERAFGRVAGRSMLVVCGKGNNGGDALIALHHLLVARPRATALVLVVPGFSRLRPLVRRALENVQRDHATRVS